MRYKRCPAIPETIIRVINALYADYDRRAKTAYEGEAAQRMQRLNAALWRAVVNTCEESICCAMLFDLKNDIGYEKSSLSLLMSHKTYYRRKREAKLEAARLLGLI